MIEKLKQMLDQGRDDVLVRFGLGNEYLKQGEYAQAIVHLRKALAHDPQYSVAWKLLGKALSAAGDDHAAAKAYEQGIVVAQHRGDAQAAKEMKVFLRRAKTRQSSQ